LDSRHSLDYRKLNSSSFESIPRHGRMEYPTRYADFVANGPVWVTVKSIGPNGSVSISSKTWSRLKVGMMFTTDDWSGIDVEITRLGTGSASGRVYYFFNSDRPLKVGDKLSTGGRYITPHDPDDKRLTSPPKPPKAAKPRE
jgi:hypothetical protein